MNMNKEMYNLPKVAKLTGIDYGTVWARANSRYAESRWGVKSVQLPDGTIKKFVPKDQIHKWIEKDNVMGRPTANELKEYEK